MLVRLQLQRERFSDARWWRFYYAFFTFSHPLCNLSPTDSGHPLPSVTPSTASEAFSLDRILKDNSCYFPPPLLYSFVYSREKMHFSCFVLLSSFSSFCSLLLFLWICSDKPTTNIPTIMLHKTQHRMEAIGICTQVGYLSSWCRRLFSFFLCFLQSWLFLSHELLWHFSVQGKGRQTDEDFIHQPASNRSI